MENYCNNFVLKNYITCFDSKVVCFSKQNKNAVIEKCLFNEFYHLNYLRRIQLHDTIHGCDFLLT